MKEDYEKNLERNYKIRIAELENRSLQNELRLEHLRSKKYTNAEAVAALRDRVTSLRAAISDKEREREELKERAESIAKQRKETEEEL